VVSLLSGLLAICSACGAERGEPPDPPPDVEVDPQLPRDRDGDGLCDDTERDAETDPAQSDTDGDGLSDLAEAGNHFDPRDATSPAAERLAVLEGVPGAVLRFAVRATVSGDGQGLTGFFEAVPSAYDLAGSAADYFAGAVAVSADPGDNVRGFEPDSERFGVVVGETRLGFDLRFTYPDPDPQACAAAYPFRYSLKSDGGEAISQRLYLLLVEPPRDGASAREFCVPNHCF
jgi:hypothetical protein